MASMMAAVITEPRKAELREVATPVPTRSEVLIHVQGCGICGSNIPVWEGRPWFEYPLDPGAPGHEGWGFIHGVGDEVRNLVTGQRVAFLSTHSFAQYDVAPGDQVVPLPPVLDDIAFPGEPLACAMNVFERSRVQRGDYVAIIGIGFLGAVLVGLAANAGAHVTAISRRESALALAKNVGAEEAVRWDGTPKSAGTLGERQFRCVIEAVGTQGALDLATQLTETRGTLVVAGYHQDGKREIDMRLWNWRGIDVINAHERDPHRYMQGMQKAIQAVAGKSLDPAPLFTHTFDLDRVSDAFEIASSRTNGCMKALVLT
jgi:NADPH:quinone reductase